jgi:hypothetical protein
MEWMMERLAPRRLGVRKNALRRRSPARGDRREADGHIIAKVQPKTH